MGMEIDKITETIIGCAFTVSNTLGVGFLEKVYENALMREFALQGLNAQSQVPLCGSYKGQVVGRYVVDLLVENRILVELKAQEQLPASSEAQLINYLRASGKKIGLLINRPCHLLIKNGANGFLRFIAIRHIFPGIA